MHLVLRIPVNVCTKCNMVMVSSTSCSRLKLPLAVVTATMGTKLSMLHSITFLPFDNLGVSPVGHGKE